MGSCWIVQRSGFHTAANKKKLLCLKGEIQTLEWDDMKGPDRFVYPNAGDNSDLLYPLHHNQSDNRDGENLEMHECKIRQN